MSNAIRSVLATVLMLAAAAAVQAAGNAAPMNESAHPAPAGAANTVKVRVLIFSGRPDPEFAIPASEIAPFMKKAKRISYKGKGIIPAQLGYKGVLVENPAKAGGLPELFAIYNGKIEAGLKEKTYYADDKRSFEKFLVNEAVKRKALEEDLYKRIKIEDNAEGEEGKGK